MDQFLQGLDPEMTSTQQTQFTEDPSMVCLLILFFFQICVHLHFHDFFFHGNKKILKFIHIFFQVETEEFIAGKSFDSFSQNTSRHEVQSKGSSKKAKKKKRKSIVGF